ncbi:hypothetical protein [Sediminicola sp. 1XM1-17]|uniref:hypothetical protein n=1 Tax=Sediminicola sp. 1XM1-17 TaxID=3127702 RepID=UPI0030778224
MSSMAMAQDKLEREHRIKKSQVPASAIHFMESKIAPVKKIRYYREIDTSTVHYISKFKKDRLHYGIQFSEDGKFQHVAITVKAIDIPKDSWDNIMQFMNGYFSKHKIKKVYQQYKATKEQSEKVTLKNAFQNLILPDLTYRVLAKGSIEGKCQAYEILVDAEGNLISLKKSLPPNYDHILY